MGVYIKGMTMPKNCDECHIREKDTCPLIKTNVTGWDRPLNCPLIELPPHGRLIDADAAAKQGWTISRTYSASPNEMVYEVKTMDDEVLPTIIPADESDMDSFIRIFEGDDEEDGMDSFIRILKD